jgi:hypothetical protein
LQIQTEPLRGAAVSLLAPPTSAAALGVDSEAVRAYGRSNGRAPQTG